MGLWLIRAELFLPVNCSILFSGKPADSSSSRGVINLREQVNKGAPARKHFPTYGTGCCCRTLMTVSRRLTDRLQLVKIAYSVCVCVCVCAHARVHVCVYLGAIGREAITYSLFVLYIPLDCRSHHLTNQYVVIVPVLRVFIVQQGT